MDYYSLFWGPVVISTTDELWGAFTCRLSALAIFVDSGPFCGLLLTVLGSQSDFHSCQTRRCAYVSAINSRSFGRFSPFSWTTTFWGPGVISTTEELRGAFTCRSSTLSIFVDSGPFCGLLLTVLGYQSDFHCCRTPRCA